MKKLLLTVFTFTIFCSGTLKTQWFNISPPGNDTAYYCIDVVNQNVVYAGKGSHGIVVKSTNGGVNWSTINTPSVNLVYKIQFINETTGFIATGSGLFKTNTGGASWQQLTTVNFADINFISESTGFLINIDFPAKIYRTTNGGANFSVFSMSSSPSYYGQALSFISPSAIYALTVKPAVDSSIVFKCTNWDSGWVPVLKTKPACYDISFADANTGIVCGNFGVFRRSSDGGNTWQSQTPAGNVTILSCLLNTQLTGYLVCGNGSIYKSTNSGLNWSSQVSGTTFYLTDIDVLNSDNTGFITGENGTILKTTNGGLTFISPVQNSIPEDFMLEPNYPNPFNPVTKIIFNLAEYGYTELTVYDITGKEVQTLASGNLLSGKYEITFDASGLSSGIYLYRIKSGSFIQTRSMVLIK